MSYAPKLFIETSIFNFYFDGKQGRKQRDTILFFEAIAKGKYEAFTSQLVMKELWDAPPEKYIKMQNIVEKYLKGSLDISGEVERMAGLYVSKGIIPLKHREDAFHLAATTVHNLDFIISFNQGHIVKTKTMIGAGLVNLHEGYRQIGISTPTELLEYD